MMEQEAGDGMNLLELMESHGVKLQKAGKEYKGRCPFHADTNPSLSVNPDKGVWHCFGCGASGNAETFLQRIEPDFEAKRAKILSAAADHYARALPDHAEAVRYVKGRCLAHKWLIESYRIGYGDGSIANTAAKRSELKNDLKRVGVLTKKKALDRFYGFITVPIVNQAGETVGLYGRRVDSNREPPHYYLSGSHRCAFNEKAIKRDAPLIVCECVIDALTLIANGFQQVTCAYGAFGWTPHHTELVHARNIRRLYLALDPDDAGEKGVKMILEKTQGLGVEFYRVSIPAGEDVNSLFQKGETAEVFRQRIEAAERIEATPASTPSANCQTSAFRADGDEGAILERDARRYVARGFNAYGMSRMRVTVRAEIGNNFHIDTLDLYAARSRSSFIREASGRFALPPDMIEGDLMALIAGLEDLRDRRTGNKPTIEIKPITADAKTRALAFLKNPKLLDEVVADMETLGYVREEQNKALGYLIGISRKLAEPLSCIAVSRSGAGKSHLLDVVELLTPPEDIVPLSTLTPQALYYMDRDELVRKLVIIEERSGSEEADYSIRQLQSKKVLRKGVAIKDPITGQIKTVRLEVRGPISYMESTTNPDIHPENANRCFVLYVDESKEQTALIHAYQRRLKTREGFLMRMRQTEIIEKHHNAQRLLDPVEVFCPFAEHIRFPDDRLRTRRDHARFLNLIEAITFLNQHQRPGGEIEITNADGQVERRRYVESTPDDYAAAYKLASAILSDNLHDLSHGAQELKGQLVDLCEHLGKKSEAKDGVAFRQRDVREWTKWSQDQVKTYLRQLVDMEYVEIVHGGAGRMSVYRLSDVSTNGAGTLAALPTPSQLAERWQRGSNGNGQKPARVKPNRGEPGGSGVLQQLRTYSLERQKKSQPVGAVGGKGSSVA